MKKIKVFIDGSEGTTGLRITERLSQRGDIELIPIAPELRKDSDAIKECISASDFTFLCLPDDAAREAVALAEGTGARIIDASTAHRTQPGWVYGFPELGYREQIRHASRVAVPGCHASGFLSVVKPLTQCGVIPKSTPVSCFSLTGYSGGGKKMIAQYEADGRDPLLSTPRIYGLSQTHKHLREMKYIASLDTEPVFFPVVDDYYSGMAVSVGFHVTETGMGREKLEEFYKDYYKEGLVHVADGSEVGLLPAGLKSGRDDMTIYVCGNDERVTVTSVFDNLGKGASGAAIQCLNLMCNADESYSLLT